ncbi:MAG: hypothetical protein QW144_01365 [Candidatus Micrarchaeaceae archaeon]
MVVDPNEMLIFKMRNMHFAEPKPYTSQKQSQALQQPAQPKAEELVKPQAKAVEENPPAAQPPRMVSAKAGAARAEETAQKVAEESKYITEEVLEKGFAAESWQPQGTEEVLTRPKKLTKTEKESIDAAKGLTCVLHPWRPAYAICSYCKRPFCYADLVEYNDKFYCLEDIDKVATGREAIAITSYNRFSNAAGAIFLATAVIFGYFIYPQLAYIAGYIASSGFGAFLLNYQKYATPLLNMIITLMFIAAGINVLVRRGKGSYSSAILGGLIIVAISYEYLSSSISYLLLTSLLSFASIALLAYGRAAKSATEEEMEIKSPGTIEWPRLETF